jgi:hypothetical protein
MGRVLGLILIGAIRDYRASCAALSRDRTSCQVYKGSAWDHCGVILSVKFLWMCESGVYKPASLQGFFPVPTPFHTKKRLSCLPLFRFVAPQTYPSSSMSFPPLANPPSSSCGTEGPTDTLTAPTAPLADAETSNGSSPGSPAPTKPEESIPRRKEHWTSELKKATSVYNETGKTAGEQFDAYWAITEPIQSQLQIRPLSFLLALRDPVVFEELNTQWKRACTHFKKGLNILTAGTASLDGIVAESKSSQPGETEEDFEARSACHYKANELRETLTQKLTAESEMGRKAGLDAEEDSE